MDKSATRPESTAIRGQIPGPAVPSATWIR